MAEKTKIWLEHCERRKTIYNIAERRVQILDKAILFCLKNNITMDSVGNNYIINGYEYVLTENDTYTPLLKFTPMNITTKILDLYAGQILTLDFISDKHERVMITNNTKP